MDLNEKRLGQLVALATCNDKNEYEGLIDIGSKLREYQKEIDALRQERNVLAKHLDLARMTLMCYAYDSFISETGEIHHRESKDAWMALEALNVTREDSHRSIESMVQSKK